MLCNRLVNRRINTNKVIKGVSINEMLYSTYYKGFIVIYYLFTFTRNIDVQFVPHPILL